MPTVIPSGVTQVDTRDGNSYEIYRVQHTTGAVTDIVVSDSCVSCAVLPDTLAEMGDTVQESTTSAGITISDRTTGASGLSPNAQVWIANDGMKQITIVSGRPTGTYVVVARFAGSGSGVGHGANTLNF